MRTPEACIEWLLSQASGPMSQSREHIDTCNNLTACAEAMERLVEAHEKLSTALCDPDPDSPD